MLYVIINTGQNIIFRPGGEIGKNVFLAKISSYMVCVCHFVYSESGTDTIYLYYIQECYTVIINFITLGASYQSVLLDPIPLP